MCRNARQFTSIITLLSGFVLTALATCVAQQQAAVAGPSSEGTPSETVPTFHASTHMVTLELVARDHQGRPVKGLSANDFHVFERATGWRKEKSEQKIAVFKPMGTSELTSENTQKIQAPAGVYTNFIAAQTTQVPPTILLVDGLNTEIRLQMQVHAQMLRMLRSLPSDVPVAVLLLGHHLRMLQSFTTDPALLKAALQKASTPEASHLAQIDPSDDPDSLSATMESMGRVPPDALKAVQRFEQEEYASTMDSRVQETIDALTSIARHVAGYPGRKNLLWISSSFPLTLIPGVDGFVGVRQYDTQMRKAANALAEAKIAVYPIDPAGVEAQRHFQSDTRLRAGSNRNFQDTLNRESIMRMNLQETMEMVAEQTGGKVCVNDNDLGDCIARAVNDSSAFYEISYYPDQQNWNGEFRKIIVKTSRPGLSLSYRQGYFARPEGNTGDPKAAKAELQQAACEDFLNATSILVLAKSILGDSPDQLKYNVAVDSSMVTFIPGTDGSEELNVTIAICTFDKSRKPLQLKIDPISAKFNAREYQAVQAARGFSHTLTVVPEPQAVAVRVLVKDEPSGRFGSVNIPVAAVPAVSAGANKASPPH